MSQEQIQVPKGWKLMVLGNICDIDTGFAFKSDTFQTSGIPLVRIGNIQNEKVEFKGSTIFLRISSFTEKFDVTMCFSFPFKFISLTLRNGMPVETRF